MTGYLIIAIKPSANRVNGGVMYKIEFQDLVSQKKLVTYVDPNNRNYHNWERVISNRDQGQVVTNLKPITKKGKELISADSKPEHVYCGNAETLADIVSEYWQKQTAPNTYSDLFEQEQNK